MKNVLILGTSGLIGEALYQKFVKLENYNVIGACRFPNEVLEAQGKLIQWDIYEKPEETAFDLSIDYDCIIVNAWDGKQRELLQNMEVNKKCAEAIYKLLKYICTNCKVEQILLCGSQAEYGQMTGKVDESTVVEEEKLSSYGWAKRYLYELLQKNKLCNAITELRFHSVFGYKKDSSQMLLMVLTKLLKNEPVNLKSTCEQKYDFLYVEDAADAIIVSVKKKIVGIFNVGTSEDITLKEYILRAEAVVNKIDLLSFGEEKGSESFIFCSDKFRKTTNWSANYSFEDGIKRVVCELKEELNLHNRKNNCRVCGKKLEKYDTIEKHVLEATDFYNEPVEGKGTDITIYCCSNCSHYQIEENISEDYYREYKLVYNPDTDNKENKGYPIKLLNYYNECFSKIEKLLDRKENVLDIGCATGDMLLLLQERFEEVMGIEPSFDLCQVARNRGLQVINDYFSSKIDFKKKFDCIVALMVLEHIEDLTGFMNAIYDNLEENGIVLINIPNGRKIVQEQVYYDVFTEHINYFTFDSFLCLVHKCNYEVISIEEGFTDGFHLTAFLRKRKWHALFSEKKSAEKNEINSILNGYNNVGVWGIGIRARSILNLVDNCNSKIKYLFDNNGSIAGKYILGVKHAISKPDKVAIRSCEIIVITSLEYYEEIINELREDYGYQGEIVYIKNGKFLFTKGDIK